MEVLTVLIPLSLFMGGIGLAAFFWSLRNRQYDAPEGAAARILTTDYDDQPAP